MRGACSRANTSRKKDATINVILVEAFDRLGGRAVTDDSQHFPFDKGPQFIHSPGKLPWTKEINPLLEIAKLCEVSVDIKDSPESLYRVRVKNIWKDIGYTLDIAAISRELDCGYKNAKEFPNAPAMLEPRAIDENIALALGSNTLGSIGESVEPWQYIASDNARQEETLPGIGFVNGGLGKLVARFGQWIQKQYPQELQVRQSTVVTEVKWNYNTQLVELWQGSQKICDCKYCIITISCQAIKLLSFTPLLPKDYVFANSYIELGSYKKIALTPVKMPKEIAANTEYHIYDCSEKCCWQYFRLPTADHVLIGVASGDSATALDQMPDTEAADALLRAINEAYPSSTPNKSSFELKLRPLVTNWSKQEHIWGAYSFTRYKGGPRDDPAPFEARRKIAEPHADGHIRFAGEATYHQAYGTLHGAYLSGQREAQIILENLGLS